MGVTAHFTGSLQIGVDMMEPHVDRSRMEQGYNGMPFPLYPIISHCFLVDDPLSLSGGWLSAPIFYIDPGKPAAEVSQT